MRENLLITYNAPSPEASRHAAAVWDLMWPLLSTNTNANSEARLTTSQAQAWRRLRKNLRGPLSDDKHVIHYCPWDAMIPRVPPGRRLPRI